MYVLQPVTSVSGGVYATRRGAKSINIVQDHKIAEEDDSIVEKDTVDERDVRKKQSIGVIYGDIGTSPLYVYSSTFSGNPSYDDLVGALSLVIWSLTIMVTIKYILIVLLADDEGEGGTFALYTLLSRYANLVERDPREGRLVRMKRYRTNELHRPNRYLRSILERSTYMKWFLKVVGVFGPFGTGRLAITFAPIVILWLMFNLSFGIYNLVHFDASVFKAFSPYFAGAFLMRNGYNGWVALGGILLAFTGVETLFADLGAFSRP
ncbi:hypothetical protein DH86_00002111 [Scytalidium sp. 3C]|nr:hypothetical protein DH86_00002111 [Scytalidium sp. 3C]